MSRQGFDLQLARHGAEGWRATFYPAGRTAHSQTSAVGSAQAPEPWVAVQRAAWETVWGRRRGVLDRRTTEHCSGFRKAGLTRLIAGLKVSVEGRCSPVTSNLAAP
jgi:hypothetical protein